MRVKKETTVPRRRRPQKWIETDKFYVFCSSGQKAIFTTRAAKNMMAQGAIIYRSPHTRKKNWKRFFHRFLSFFAIFFCESELAVTKTK